MNYLDAKTVLLQDSPRVPFNLVAMEIAILVAVASIMVLVFT